MAQQLRQRNVLGGSSTPTMMMNHNNNDEDDEVILGRGLEAPAMLEASPSQNGTVLKLHVPLLYSVLPESVKRLVLAYDDDEKDDNSNNNTAIKFITRCLSFSSWLLPKWQPRYLILIGSFLYKFKSESYKSPKGTPFSVDRVEANLLITTTGQNDAMASTFAKLPPGYDALFTVETFGKKHYYAVNGGREEALAWVNSLRQNRQEAITRKMGHSPANMPYPKSWSYFDSLGESLIRSKQRIKDRAEQRNLREMELTTGVGGGMIGGSGPAPTGFYG